MIPFGGDEATFREQWMHAMFGINSGDMHVVVENMKALCGDIMAAAMAGERAFRVKIRNACQ